MLDSVRTPWRKDGNGSLITMLNLLKVKFFLIKPKFIETTSIPFQGAFAPVIPFFSRIPVDRQEEYLDDYVKFSLDVKPDPGVIVQNFKAGQDVNIFVAYRTVVAFAKK